MALKATSVRLDDDTLARVGQMAEALDRPRAWLMAEAIKQYVNTEEWFVKEVQRGIKSADEGRLITHDAIRAKWEGKRATVAIVGMMVGGTTTLNYNRVSQYLPTP